MKNHQSSHRILVILSREPSSVGHGGNHRSYQILHDLQSTISQEHLILVSLKDIQQTSPHEKRGYSWQDYLKEIRNRLNFSAEILKHSFAPYRIFEHLFKKYSDFNHFFPFDEQKYLKILEKHAPIDLCIIDHTMFLEITQLNCQKNVTTWVLPQNLETFDMYALTDSREKKNIPFLMAFRQELQALSICAERFAISQHEQWLLKGLDLPTQYYPYLPVGDIRDFLVAIRSRRSKVEIQRKQFLMLGTSTHTTTGKSFEWFFENAAKFGLPDDIKILVAGKGTQNFREKYTQLKNIEFRGWVTDEELGNLLCSVNAVLAPQLLGFGTVTRISELACAGVPLLISEHAAKSIDLPPGIVSLPNDWSAWMDAMTNALERKETVIPDWKSYHRWYENQPNPIKTLLERHA